MGRFYQTAKPKFIDHIYQPDQNLQLAEAKAEIEEDALMKTFASNAELGIKPALKQWQEDMNSEVNALNEEIEPLVQELMTEGTNAKTIRKLNDLKRKAQEAYSTGNIGTIARETERVHKDYEEKLEAAKKIKNPGERAAELSRLSNWRKHIAERAKGGYKDFSYSNYSNFIDSAKYLEEHLDAENLKSSQTYLKRKAAPVINGKILTEEERKEMGVVYSNGKYFIPDGNDYKDITVGVGDPEWKKIFPFKYQATTITEEGFDTDLIARISESMLYNNQAVFDMYAQDFRDFGKQKYFDVTTGTVKIADNAEEYAAGMIELKAKEYAERFKGTKKEESVQHLTDTASQKAYFQNRTYDLKNQNAEPFITTTLDGKDTILFVEEDIEAYKDYQLEKQNFVDSAISQMITYDYFKLTPSIVEQLKAEGTTPQQLYADLTLKEKEKARNDFINNIKKRPNSNLYGKLQELEDKYIDLITYGTVEYENLLEDVPAQHRADVMKDAQETLNSEIVKQSVREAAGYYKFQDDVYFGSVNGGNAKKVTDAELIGQTYNNPNSEYHNYRIVAIDPEDKMMVTPKDSKRKGNKIVMGSATKTTLVLMEEEAYREYRKDQQGTASGNTTQTYVFNPGSLGSPKNNLKYADKMVTVDATKIVNDQKHTVNIHNDNNAY